MEIKLLKYQVMQNFLCIVLYSIVYIKSQLQNTWFRMPQISKGAHVKGSLAMLKWMNFQTSQGPFKNVQIVYSFWYF